MLKYILFDLDGTLTDPAEGITKSIAYALREMGRTVPPTEELYKFIGPPLHPSFIEFFGMSDSEASEAVRLYRVRFSDVGWRENVPYEGIVSQLSVIRGSGLKLALATSKPEKFAVDIMNEFGLAEYFDEICGSSLDGNRSEKSEVIRYALCRLGIGDIKSAAQAGEIAMVGDRKYDILGAREVGAIPIGVLWGYGNEAELIDAGAAKICADVSELAAAVLG